MTREAILTAAALLVFGASPPVPAAPVPGSECTVFPSDNIWNTKIKELPVHSRSEEWLKSMDSRDTLLHPDFGGSPYGFPYEVVDEAHLTTEIDFLYEDESDPGPYPFDGDTPIEAGSDRHALMINEDTCVLYELFDAHWNHGEPTAGSGAVFDLSSNDLRPNEWTSADAAGLPIFAGLVRYEEVTDGAIKHAIRVTAELTDKRHIWPARHDAGAEKNRDLPPMGARFRLKKSYDISEFSDEAQVILRAMKRYGLILADNGSNWFFSGTQDEAWTDDLLDELKSVPAKKFQAVDASSLKVEPGSGEASA